MDSPVKGSGHVLLQQGDLFLEKRISFQELIDLSQRNLQPFSATCQCTVRSLGVGQFLAGSRACRGRSGPGNLVSEVTRQFAAGMTGQLSPPGKKPASDRQPEAAEHRDQARQGEQGQRSGG